MEKKKFTVEGMKCAHCEANVEAAVKAVAGVVDAKADRETASLTIEYDGSKATIDDFKGAVENAGRFELVL